MRRAWALVAGLTLLLTGCLTVTPNGPYSNGQSVTVNISAFGAGDTVWLSECAPGQTPVAATGCARTLAGQRTVRLDRTGTGKATFTLSRVVGGISCLGYCSVAATNGKRVQTVFVSFAVHGILVVGSDIFANPYDVYLNGRYLLTLAPSIFKHPMTSAPVTVTPGTYAVAYRPHGAAASAPPIASATVTVPVGQGVTVALYALVTGHAPPAPNSGPPATYWVPRLSVVNIPAPPGPARVRVLFVNRSPVTVSLSFGTYESGLIPPGGYATLTQTATDATQYGFRAHYPESPPSQWTCGTSTESGLQGGKSYVVTIVAPPVGGNPVCSYQLEDIAQGGLG